MSKIILVEDDPTMLSLLQTLLEMEGYQVIKIKNEIQQDILSVMQQERPELALIDVHLRQLNGFDLLQGIRKDEYLKDTRILMSSGMDLRNECLQKGADGFILKPYMPDDLIHAIQQALMV